MANSRLTFELYGRDNASPVFDKFGRRVDQTRDRVSLLDRASRNLGPTLAALGLAKMATDSVKLEAAYSRTMAQVGVATGEAGKELKKLDDLAMKLGADTTFSAKDAGDAMLELAKGGLSSAEIQAGSLANTLTLATAGGLELGDAANTVVQAMGAFGLGAKDTGGAVAALAGAANASSADVSGIAQALSQAGTSASAAGLSIQDTTAYLAMFADAGIQGSDAGTSLKTMLSRLVPQTKSAMETMEAFGLTYLDANGNLVDAEEIAARTQKAFKGLDDEQRMWAIQTIFGADAQRAANVLINQGEEGLKRYKRATSDLSQAEKLAKASTSGTAGALEQLSGAYETAQIQVGKGLAPAVEELANKASEMVENGDFEKFGKQAGEVLTDLGDIVIPLAESTFPAMATAFDVTADAVGVLSPAVRELAEAFNAMPQWAQTILVGGATAKMLGVKLPAAVAGGAAASGGAAAAGAAAASGAAAAGRGAASRTAGQAAAAAGGSAARFGAGRALGVIGLANIAGSIYNEKLLDSVQNDQEKARRGIALTREEMRQQVRDADRLQGAGKRINLAGSFDKATASSGRLASAMRRSAGAADQVTEGVEKLDKTDANPSIEPRGVGPSLGSIGRVVDGMLGLDQTPANPRIRPNGVGSSMGSIGRVVDRMLLLDGTTASPRVAPLGIASTLYGLEAIANRISILNNTTLTTPSGGDRRRASGGAILGPGSGTSDDVLVRSSNGEHMLPANEVELMGGQSAVYEWRRRLREGRGEALAGTRAASTSPGPASAVQKPPESTALLRETQRTNQLLGELVRAMGRGSSNLRTIWPGG